MKINQKMQLLPYLPYGFCSKLATTISGIDNTACTKVLQANGRDLESKCADFRERASDRVRYTREIGLAKEAAYRCGTPVRNYSFQVLTKIGFLALTEAPMAVCTSEEKQQAECKGSGPDNDGNIKGYIPNKQPRHKEELQETLLEYMGYSNPMEQDSFNEFLLDAVQSGIITPLTSGLAYASDVKISTAKYSYNQLYNIWRLSQINAMFIANNHLTYLDRRPYDTGFAIDGIADEASYSYYLKKHGMTMAAFCYRVLNDWYSRNPDYHYFNQQNPDDAPEAREEWLNTPAFYSALELPIISDKEPATEDLHLMGSQQKLNSVAVGLATGKVLNYVCYHAKAGPISWKTPREERTIQAMELAVHAMKTQNPDLPIKDKIQYAFYFCPTHHQFLALFNRTKEKYQKHQNTDHPMKKPYQSVHVIPVNDSGSFLLWCLLEESPSQITHRICNNLVNSGLGFEHTANPVFPLLYKGARVFTGYTMDISKINEALVEYLNGRKFHICCFTEQAKWYRMLFPDVQIL